MFENRNFKDKDEQANAIWRCYLDIMVIEPEDGIDYPKKIGKLLALIKYAEQELVTNVHSYNFSEHLPTLKDAWLGHFYKHLSKLYRYNQSLEKSNLALAHANILYPGIEEL
jgi:hypothetical protein